MIFTMTSSHYLPTKRVTARRQRRQVSQAMLRAVGKPLVLIRQARRQAKRSGPPASVLRSLEFLLRELTLAARALAKRLKVFGVPAPRRSLWSNATGRLRHIWAHATAWSRRILVACQGCAGRLCKLFQVAQVMRDRPSSRIAYSLLRTMEKELWLIRSNINLARPVSGI